MTMQLPASRKDAVALDASDPLRHARKHFALEEGLIYLVGHSLGPATSSALAAVSGAATSEWKQGLVRSWNSAGWFDLARAVGARIARLIGAGENEVIIADSVTTNLFKLAAAARPLARHRVLIVEEDEFPTDQYVIEALAQLAGTDFVRAAPGRGIEAMAQTGGVLVKSVVNYRTAEVTDIRIAETEARSAGGVIIWDLSHATGVLDVDLNSSGAIFAAGCTYKYLNGGPGAPAFAYVSSDVVSRITSPLPGWMGHARPFDFDPHYEPAADIRRFANGTPPILSLRALGGALDAFDGLGMLDVQTKAAQLGDLVLARTEAMGLRSTSPPIGAMRGGHVSVTHADGYAVVQALMAAGVVTDFRAPDTIRFGLSPLFLSFADVWDAMEVLERILDTGEYKQPQYQQRATVT